MSNPFSYSDQGWNLTGHAYNQPHQVQNATNIIRVTSLEEAVMRTTTRGCDMVYFDQDRDVFYRVKVDWDGKKSWAEFQFMLPAVQDTTPVFKNDFQALVNKVEQLEARLKEVQNGKSDGSDNV